MPTKTIGVCAHSYRFLTLTDTTTTKCGQSIIIKAPIVRFRCYMLLFFLLLLVANVSMVIDVDRDRGRGVKIIELSIDHNDKLTQKCD